jgi:16S rRNA (guanine527-N7)-methyltransferase
LERLGDLIADAPMNLVSQGDRDHVRRVHIAESRLVTAALALRANTHCLDLGSGGGLPGLVIAVLRPDVSVLCLDARAKKVRFVQSAVEALSLANVSTRAGRAEMLAREPRLRAAVDVVVCRAVGQTHVVAELARGFLRDGGSLSVIKGPRHSAEVVAANAVAHRLHYGQVAVEPVQGCPRPTFLLHMVARGRAPAWVPRGNGIPQSQPLRAEAG